MNIRSLSATLVLLMVGTLLAPFARAQDAQLKPVAVLSLTDLQELRQDLTFLTIAADIPDLGAIANLMITQFSQGIDAQRPSGLYATMDGATPQGVAFVPVSNFDMIRTQIEERLGEVEDAGNGVLRVDMPEQAVYLKPVDGWVFVSNSSQSLAGTPKDPSKLVQGLAEQYDVALQVNMRNVPAEVRDAIVTQMKAGFEQGFNQSFEGTDEERELAEKVSRNAIENYVSLVQDTDVIKLGWAIDREKKATYLDLSLTAVAGTRLAKQMARMQDTTSDFAGFRMEGAAMSVVLSSKMGPEEIEQATSMLGTLRENALKQIDEDADLPDDTARGAVKDTLNTVFDVIQKTVEQGRIEGGAVVMLKAGAMQMAAGGHCADGRAMEQAFRKLVNLAKDEPEFPEVKFNVETYNGVLFHTMKVPVPEDEEEAQQVLGEQLDVVLGVADKSVYMAMGRDSMSLLKQIIDRSKSAAGQPVPPLELSVALAPILEFANSMEDNPLIDALSQVAKQTQGQDHVAITARAIDQGVLYRVNVEQGVLKLVGQGVKIMMGQQQPGDDF